MKCPVCGKDFRPIRYDQRYCDKVCSAEGFAAERREALAFLRAERAKVADEAGAQLTGKEAQS
jgi:RNA polymerase subunit RPABC4/transcription elongation factor Spt4